MKVIACTLVEGAYEYGAAALFNSLVSCGFNGAFWIGYRGSRPFRHFHNAERFVTSNNDVRPRIQFKEIDWSHHMNYVKPNLIITLLKEEEPDCIFYFDADIVTLARWGFFEEWVEFGVALAQDAVWFNMHETHPIKGQWGRILRDSGFTSRSMTGYANSGFIGLRTEHASLVEVWRDLIALRPSLGVPFNEVRRDITQPIATYDQDLLNMAIMGSDVPFALAGLEGMAMKHGKAYMAHVNSGPKPWQRGLFAAAVRGRPPTIPYKAFWNFCRSPIRIYSAQHLRMQRAKIVAAQILAKVCAR